MPGDWKSTEAMSQSCQPCWTTCFQSVCSGKLMHSHLGGVYVSVQDQTLAMDDDHLSVYDECCKSVSNNSIVLFHDNAKLEMSYSHIYISVIK